MYSRDSAPNSTGSRKNPPTNASATTAVRRAARPSGLVKKRANTLGSPIVPRNSASISE